MKRNKLSAMAIMAAFGLLVAAGSAHADDTATADDASAKTVREDSVETVPAWKAFGSGDQEVLEETFFRLAQDFVGTSEIGVRRLGQVPIWPRGELKVGPVRILPYLRESLEWESNVYKRPSTGAAQSNLSALNSRNRGRESGYTWVNQAGILADTRLMGGRLRIALSAESRWNESLRTHQPDTWEFDSQLGATYRWSNGAWVRGGVSYVRRSDPIEIEIAGNEFQRTNTNLFFSGGFDKDIFFGSKAKLEVGMTVRDVAPNSGEFQAVDRTETEFYAKASYPFWKKTTQVFVRARYRRESRESHTLNDGDVIGFDAGIDGNFPLFKGQHRGIRGSISFGFDHAEYDAPATTTSGGRRVVNGDDDDRKTSLAIRAALQYVISSRSTVDLRMLRTNQFSVFGNFQIIDRADLTYSRNITPRLTGRVSSFIEHTDPSGETPRSSNSLGRSPNRHMTRGGIGIGARYKINEWLDADLSYDYERRNAAVDRRYTNHRVALGLTFYMSALRPKPRRERPK